MFPTSVSGLAVFGCGGTSSGANPDAEITNYDGPSSSPPDAASPICGDGGYYDEENQQCVDTGAPADMEMDAYVSPDVAVGRDAGPGETREVILGANRNQTLFRGGIVVTADDSGDVESTEGGQVFTDGDGIACVGSFENPCEGTEDATIIQLASTDKIYPGLIDTHNHPHYNFCPLFEHPGECYTHNSVWQASREYSDWKDHYSRPNEGAVCEEYQHGFVTSLIGGASAIQGVGVNRRCFRQTPTKPLLGRLLDSFDGIRDDHVRTWTMGIVATPDETVQGACDDIDAGDVDRIFLHIAEGPRVVPDERTGELVENPAIREEFDALYEKAGGCLTENGRAAAVVMIHSNFTRDELEALAGLGASPRERPKIVWSPSSNTDLSCSTEYATPSIPDILELGFTVSLGPDWRPSHGIGMVPEANVARRYAGEFFPAGSVTDEELFKMMTVNAAEAAALGDHIGRLAPGMRADITVITGETGNPFEPAHLDDVAGVMVDGVLYYGDRWLMAATTMDPGDCEDGIDALNICGVEKRLCIPPTVDGETVRFGNLVDGAFVYRPNLDAPDILEPYTPESFDTVEGACR